MLGDVPQTRCPSHFLKTGFRPLAQSNSARPSDQTQLLCLTTDADVPMAQFAEHC